MDRMIKYGYVALFIMMFALISWPFFEEPLINHGSRSEKTVSLTFKIDTNSFLVCFCLVFISSERASISNMEKFLLLNNSNITTLNTKWTFFF